MDVDPSGYYAPLAAAFVLGRLARRAPSDGEGDGGDAAWLARGREAGLRLHKFKRSELPRTFSGSVSTE